MGTLAERFRRFAKRCCESMTGEEGAGRVLCKGSFYVSEEDAQCLEQAKETGEGVVIFLSDILAQREGKG